jgi:MYXO-CTERM domain-containing protein
MNFMRGMAGFTAAACIACTARASIVSYNSNPGIEGLGSYSGSTEWTYLGGNAGVVEITLTNTSDPANGGFLTGFAFNVAPQVKMAYDEGRAGWDGVFEVSASPLGDFDHGAALGGNWLGGGSPVLGIGVGQTFVFRYDVRGEESLLATIIAHDFFDETEGWGFAARFRGFADGGSDKVTASLPSPGALALLALGSLGARRRRR